MSRRDTILMAVLVNAALLAILFMTAVSPDGEVVTFKQDDAHLAVMESASHSHEEVAVVPAPPKDEIDHLLVEGALLPQEAEAASEPLKRFSDYTEVTVKRGDVLERIARANKTSVATLKKINNLKSERIDVGQVLKVPVAQTQPVAKAPPVIEGDREFYVVQEGDNPWKIAKQFHVGFEELLDLNHLDEMKARNLKVGDQIRVH